MDFFTWPELLLSIFAVAAVFVTATGVMILFATQLTQDDDSFLMGIAVPLVLASYFRGWETLGIWVLLTVFAMLAVKAKTLQWIVVSLGTIALGLGSIVLFNKIGGGWLGAVLAPVPWLVICGGTMALLRWEWPRWVPWLGIVFLPALVLCGVAQAFGEKSLAETTLRGIYLSVALILASVTPIRLALRKPVDCGPSIRLGISLAGGGSAVVLAAILIHNAHFVR